MSAAELTLSERITRGITILIRLSLLAVGIFAVFNGRWSVVFAAGGALILCFIPQFLANQIRVKLPLQFQFAITLFLCLTIFMGEVGDYYEKFWWWDVVLHAGSAFAFGFAGFLIIYLLYARHKITASPLVASLFALSFGMAIGTLWEIFEFAVDQLFGLNMQKSGLRDTMWDLIVDTLGAGVASFIGYIYLRFKIRDPFDTLIEWFLRVNPRFRTKKFLYKKPR